MVLSSISYLDLHKNLNGMPLDNKYCMEILKLIDLSIEILAMILVLMLWKAVFIPLLNWYLFLYIYV